MRSEKVDLVIDDGGTLEAVEADAAIDEPCAEKSEKDGRVIDDGGALEAMEDNYVEEVHLALHGTREVVAAVDKFVVEIAHEALSPVLQSETEKTESLFGTEKTDSWGKILHEKEQVATDPVAEVVDDSIKTSLEFVITQMLVQGGRESKSESLKRGESEPDKEFENSSHGEDSLP